MAELPDVKKENGEEAAANGEAGPSEEYVARDARARARRSDAPRPGVCPSAPAARRGRTPRAGSASVGKGPGRGAPLRLSPLAAWRELYSCCVLSQDS